MTGPEHHREAARLIEAARKAGIQGPRIPTPTYVTFGGAPDLPDIPDYGKLYTDEDSDPRCRNLLAVAQVHATLALAAALQASQPDRTSRPAAATPHPETPTPPHDPGADVKRTTLPPGDPTLELFHQGRQTIEEREWIPVVPDEPPGEPGH